MNIEKIATSSIENLISRNSFLEPIINNNDKTPVWDGDVFVYRTKDRNKSNKDLIGRVPVQVKGHEVEIIDGINLKNIRFRVNKGDLQKYITDGGVIYFVVYVDKNTEKIFYNSLLPLDLARLMKKYSQQNTFEIELKSLPVEERKLADIFLDFVQNRKKQQGTLMSQFLYMDDIEKIKNEIKEFKFSYSTVGPKGSIPFKELTTRDIYIYAKPKGIGNPIPIERVSNAIVNIQHKLEISIKGQVYYSDAYIQWENGIPDIRCGKAVRISIPNFESTEYHNFNLKIDFVGTLNERIRDLCFIKDMIKHKEFSIDKSRIPFENFNFEHEEDLYEQINNLKLLKQRLEYYGVKADLNLDILTDEDDIKLSIVMEENPPISKYNIDLSGSRILKMKIANIAILLMVEEDMKEGCYKLKNFFANTWNVTYVLTGTTEHIPMSQFLVLGKEGLLVDNIDSQKVINDIKRNHSENKNIGYVNTFLLEAIKAYDECSIQQAELGYLIVNLSRWLYEQSNEDYIFLNLAQIKYRVGRLANIDIGKIMHIRGIYKDNIEMLAGIYILLDEKEQARDLINKMDKDEREIFMDYPIYYLLENKEID